MKLGLVMCVLNNRDYTMFKRGEYLGNLKIKIKSKIGSSLLV